ncbi:hypothetical protein Bhyg_06724 [Pseudolycoriella hygida]|uniref:MD-2-related lipid-recognition domain-containing protein n=1 Tax=Pseudolycoriella hygida TaxID=35572 RepID=A0A9Q0N2T8_9DIPT|nr:hypothetical protein Bhyg_06724 [Pseudolycoriella hygida]
MIAYLIVAAVLPAFISANLAIIPCPGLAGVAPAALRIPGCDVMPCHVGHVMPNHGHSFRYETDFDSHFASETLTLRATETAFGVETELNLSEEDRNACNGLIGASCPVQAHQRLTHGTTIEGEGDFHDGIPVQIRVEISDDDHICMCTLINLIVH